MRNLLHLATLTTLIRQMAVLLLLCICKADDTIATDAMYQLIFEAHGSVFALCFLFHIPKLVSGGKGKHKKVRNQAIADKLVYNCIPLYSTVYSNIFLNYKIIYSKNDHRNRPLV